jgi:prepilin-type N-terminal cleavage/methylation domain-containing protein
VEASRPDGFTVIEMVVVLSMLAVVAGTAYPRLVDLVGATRIDADTRAVAAELQRARFRAIAENGRVRVAFSSTNVFTTCRESGPSTNVFNADCVSRKVDDAGWIAASAEGDTSSLPSPITFDNRGLAGAPAILRLHPRSGTDRLIRVAATGFVSVL